MSSQYVQSCRSQEEEKRKDITQRYEYRVASSNSAVTDVALDREERKPK